MAFAAGDSKNAFLRQWRGVQRRFSESPRRPPTRTHHATRARRPYPLIDRIHAATKLSTQATIPIFASGNLAAVISACPHRSASRDFGEVVRTRRSMDPPTKKIWQERQLGYSWKEISLWLGTTEAKARKKFDYGVRRLGKALFDC